MDRTGGESSNDSGNNARPSVKKRKRIRINVTQLSEEEKYWRKRFLGRERARRYRERKREIKGDVARPKGRPKNSQNIKTERLRFLLPSSGVLYRQVVVHVNGPSENTTDSPEVPTTSSHETRSQEHSSTLSVTDLTSLKKTNSNGLQTTKKDQEPSLRASNPPEKAVRKSKRLIAKPTCMNMADSEEEDRTLTNAQEFSPASIKQETQEEESDESSTNETGHNVSMHTEGKTCTTSTDGAESDQQELAKTLTKSKKTMFKQQNVKDFINFFPVDDSGSVDTGSSSGLQKQVEIVLQARKLMYKSNLSDSRQTEKPKQSSNCHDTEGERSATEQLESKGADANVSKQELTEKSAKSAPTQASAFTEVTLNPVPAVSVVSESASTQHLAQGGLQVQQALSNLQHSNLLQQQKSIGATANAQTLNTLDQTSLPNVVSANGEPDSNNISNLPGVVTSPNLQGSGLGVQGLVGNIGCQGLQGVSDPRFLQLVGLQNPSGVQNVPNLLGGLQGLTALQGVFGGLQGPTAALASPPGVVGLQGIQNLQAISGLQGIPGFHAITGLQGLVSLQGIPSYPGIQGLQGLGIAGPQQVSQSLQALAALQGNAYLQNITGASGLIAGLSSQSGIFGQPGLLVPLNQDSTGGNQPVASDKEEKNQAVADLTSSATEGTSSSESKENQLEQTADEDKEQSSQQNTTPCSECKPVPRTSTPSTPKVSHQAQKGRSRRKQASPRCISKQWCLSFDSEEMENEGQEENISGEVGQQERTVCAKGIDAELASPSLMESTGSFASKAPTDGSLRPGAKLSKKVEELMSASKPCQLSIHCSTSAEPADDESPSPQTWKRFLEREKQRSDRLREVEEQLAKLQAMTRQWQVASSKCLVSMATQTDIDWRPGPQHEGVPSPRQAAQIEESWPSMVEATDQTEAKYMIHGQIQQGVVTSSGDSHIRNLSRDGSQPEAELTDRIPVMIDDPQRSSDDNQSPPQASSDTETRIINRPYNICMHSFNRRKKSRRAPRPVRPLVPEQAAPTFGDDHQGCSDQESKESGDLFSESFENLPNMPLQSDTKYVLQVVPQNYSYVAEVSETSETVYNNVQDEPVQILSLLSESPGDAHPSPMQGERVNRGFLVPPWEEQGLSRVERNRIRAREGMRRHREKLRQAKLSSKIWWNQCVKLDNVSCGEPSSSKARSKKLKTSGCISGRIPRVVDDGKINRASSGKQKATSEMFEADPSLMGFQKKPFEVLAQVAVSAETNLNIKQEILESPTLRMETNQVEFPPCLSSSEFDIRSQQYPTSQEETKSSPNLEKVGGGGSFARKVEHIDFTQEPFRSMSLQERNRIRAREGMRRYRERLKQTRESSLQVYKMGKSARGRGSRMTTTGRGVCKTSPAINAVPAAEHLAELAKRHSSTLVSYSESVERNKKEVRKRKRAASLQGRQKSNNGHQGNADKNPVQAFGIDLKGHSSDSGSNKQGPVVFKTEPSLFGDPEQTTQDPVSEEITYPIVTRQRMPASKLQGSAAAVSISDECPDNVEMKFIKEEQGHSN